MAGRRRAWEHETGGLESRKASYGSIKSLQKCRFSESSRELQNESPICHTKSAAGASKDRRQCSCELAAYSVVLHDQIFFAAPPGHWKAASK